MAKHKSGKVAQSKLAVEAKKPSLPTNISPCPISEAIAEIRFETRIPGDFVLAFAHTVLEDTYGEPERLPLADVPPKFRDSDPNLRFLPLYKFENEHYITQIGTNVIDVICKKEYLGWKLFKSEIIRVLKLMYGTKVILKERRLGFRYVSIFEGNILPNLNIDCNFHDIVNTHDYNMLNGDLAIRSYIQKKDFLCNLHLSNIRDMGSLNMPQNTVIDIDVVNINLIKFSQNIMQYLESAHDIEKQIFFGLLKQDFLESLNPIY